ncbi:MAG: hypothetical protein GDA46_00750 [Bdellovibrionales bacterium]|nr:hypothetical protein [Bdellovibrionales bacterium]
MKKQIFFCNLLNSITQKQRQSLVISKSSQSSNKKNLFLKKLILLKFKLFSSTLFVFSLLPCFLTHAKTPVEPIDFIYLYPNLPLNYKLPDEFRNKNITFSGTYKKYTTASYRKDKNDIYFAPFRTGNSILVIRDEKKQILNRLVLSIQKDNLHKVAAELRELLISVDGIEIKIYNNKVIIDGLVMLPREMDRIGKIVADYGPIVKSFVSYSPLAQKKIAELIEKELGASEILGIQIRYAYNRFLLEGCLNTLEEKRRALEIANLYTQYEVNPVGKGAVQKSLPVLKDNIKVPCESAKKEKEEKKKEEPIKKLIQIVVHFVEMNKSFEKGFLFQWTPAIGDQGTQITGSIGTSPQLNQGITGVLTATISNFFPKLNWAKRFSFARVLHNSSLLMENNVKGEISTTTTTPNQTNQDGVILSGGTAAQVSIIVQPKIIGPNDDMIQIGTEITVSSPSDIGTTSRQLTTKINVRNGNSAVIGGLTSSFLIKNYNRNPSQISGVPILNLHRSKDYSTKKTQFIVFITPLIKPSASTHVERIKNKFILDE